MRSCDSIDNGRLLQYDQCLSCRGGIRDTHEKLNGRGFNWETTLDLSSYGVNGFVKIGFDGIFIVIGGDWRERCC